MRRRVVSVSPTFGLPIVPEGVVSTYALDVSEILSAGMDRVIVAEGAEARIEQLTASLLQRLQLTAPPWEEDMAEYGDYYAQDLQREQQRMEWEMMERQRSQMGYNNNNSMMGYQAQRPQPQQMGWGWGQLSPQQQRQQQQQWGAPPPAPPPPPPPPRHNNNNNNNNSHSSDSSRRRASL